MKERPIIFSAPMVRALLDGRKTQTRRAVRLPKYYDQAELSQLGKEIGVDWHDCSGGYVWFEQDGWEPVSVRSPFGVPGDRLWVKEAWQQFFDDEIPPERPRGPRGTMGIPAQPGRKSWVCYRADGVVKPHDQFGHPVWESPLFMPRWASRINLEIIEIRVQRLQEITDAEAMAEGCHGYPVEAYKGAAIGAFRPLWDSLNKKHPWDSNPFVWAITFRRLP